MNILERYEIIEPNLKDISSLWHQEIENRKHLLSLNSSIIKVCEEQPEKIRDYCLSLGFNGAEIRFQGLKDPLVFTKLLKYNDFTLTAHLSDFSHWLYGPKQIKDLMTESEMEAYFGNKNHQEAIKQCFFKEANLVAQLNIQNVTFHAAQIEFSGIIHNNFLFSDEQVLERVGNFISDLLLRYSFLGKIGLENDGPYSRGMRLPNHFETLLDLINIPNVGFTLDVAHFVANSPDSILSPEILRKIWLIHLSEPNLNYQAVSDETIVEFHSQNFFGKRKLIGQIIFKKDAHNPIGDTILNGKSRLDKIYQFNPNLIVVHELKVPIDIMKQACILQQSELIK